MSLLHFLSALSAPFTLVPVFHSLTHQPTREAKFTICKDQCLHPQRADSSLRGILAPTPMRGLSSCPRPTLLSVPLTPPMTCTPNLQPLPGSCSNSFPLFFFSSSSPFCQQVRREIHFHPNKQNPPNLCPPLLLQFDTSAYNPNFLKSLSLLSCFYFLISQSLFNPAYSISHSCVSQLDPSGSQKGDLPNLKSYQFFFG